DLYVVVNLEPLRPMIHQMLVQVDLPQGLHPFYEAPDLIQEIELRLNISHPGVSELVVEANNVADAEKLQDLTRLSASLWKSSMAPEIDRLKADPDPVQQALGRYLQRLMDRWTEDLV